MKSLNKLGINSKDHIAELINIIKKSNILTRCEFNKSLNGDFRYVIEKKYIEDFSVDKKSLIIKPHTHFVVIKNYYQDFLINKELTAKFIQFSHQTQLNSFTPPELIIRSREYYGILDQSLNHQKVGYKLSGFNQYYGDTYITINCDKIFLIPVINELYMTEKELLIREFNTYDNIQTDLLKNIEKTFPQHQEKQPINILKNINVVCYNKIAYDNDINNW